MISSTIPVHIFTNIIENLLRMKDTSPSIDVLSCSSPRSLAVFNTYLDDIAVMDNMRINIPPSLQ